MTQFPNRNEFIDFLRVFCENFRALDYLNCQFGKRATERVRLRSNFGCASVTSDIKIEIRAMY